MFPTISTIDKVEKHIRVARAIRALCAGWGLICFVIPLIPPYPAGLMALMSLSDLLVAGWMWTKAMKLTRDLEVYYHIKYLAEEVAPEEYNDEDQMVIKVWLDHLKALE